ncbi:MAG TPA: hypothetical protein VI072_15390 [Polyangiaceae bacterium]
MRSPVRVPALLISLVAAVYLAGCATHYIPNTDVEDNDYNRNIIEFCEKYRRAVELRNAPQLLKYAHPKYYEDGGNIDSSDDIDYVGLRSYLEERFRATKAIRYEIRYRRVGKGRQNVVYVDYTYSASYKIPTEKGDVWRRKVDDNRLELVPQGDSFQILAGM